MKQELATKTVEIMRVSVQVLAKDITDGLCGRPNLCMEKVAIERALRKKDPGIDHKVRIDGGKIVFAYKGHRWIAFTPKIAKSSLIRYDQERKMRERAERKGVEFVSKVQPHDYQFEALKDRAIKPVTKRDRKRLDQINAARKKRTETTGRTERQRYYIKHRVEGHHPAV